MVEIHVEKKPRSGWIWFLVLLLILVIAALAWYFWPVAAAPASDTATAATTVTDRSVPGTVPSPAPASRVAAAGRESPRLVQA